MTPAEDRPTVRVFAVPTPVAIGASARDRDGASALEPSPDLLGRMRV